MEKQELDDAVVAAGHKEYKDFAKVVNVAIEDKMKNHLSGFMNYLEKQTFKEE